MLPGTTRSRQSLEFRTIVVDHGKMSGMKDRYLLVADGLDDLNPKFDLGVCLSTELLNRGIAVDYLDLMTTDPQQGSESFLGDLPVREILSSDAGRDAFWELGAGHTADVGEYRVILQRKDPPVDEGFIARTRHFEAAPPEIVQINRPPATYELSEHTVALRYPEYAAPTQVCSSADEVVEAVRALPGEVVLKPENTYCGIGVTFVEPSVTDDVLRDYWEQWRPQVIVQPFLEAIETSGDLRILTINEKVLGSVLRVPTGGSRLANLHQGAVAARLEPTPRQLEACRVVAKDLNPLGLYLLGLDFIGEDLTEVNFTSPTTIVQINQVNGIRADIDLVDELERMWREGR
jgi:glutathione synthase